MAFETIADLLRSLSPDFGELSRAAHPTCHYHPVARARTLCSRCGRRLCEACSPLHDIRRLCPECRRPLRLAAAWAKRRLLSPAGVVVTTACVFSLSYALLSARVSGAPDVGTANDEPDRTALEHRSWLYLQKGARLKLSGDRFRERNLPGLSMRCYRGAARALENVLAAEELLLPGSSFPVGSTTLSGRRGEGENLGEADPVLRDCIARVAVALAECRVALGRPHDAAEALQTAILLLPKPETAGHARYLLGLIHEEHLGDTHKAVSMYREARSRHTEGRGSLEGILQVAERGPRLRSFAYVARQMTGSFKPAEAQVRLIAALRELGEDDDVEKETEYLVERFPSSDEADEARKGRSGAREAARAAERHGGIQLPAAPEDERRKTREEETLRIVPLEE